MTPPPLRARIRNGTLLMLALTLTIGAFAAPTIHKLGGSIRETLYRNYVSIDAAQHMHAALSAAELAQLRGTLPAILPRSRNTFSYWIEMNKAAMFRADSRTMRMSDRLAYEFAVGLLVLLVLGAALSWTLASNIAKPLAELAEHLRSFSLHGPSLRIGDQPLAELQAVAAEFNRMAERLEQFEKMNVDRLIYEKGKTEAILESIEDGIVLIDADGVVTHINEVASIILGVEPAATLGSPFDDLDSNHPHYLRVRSALRSVATQPLEA